MKGGQPPWAIATWRAARRARPISASSWYVPGVRLAHRKRSRGVMKPCLPCGKGELGQIPAWSRSHLDAEMALRSHPRLHLAWKTRDERRRRCSSCITPTIREQNDAGSAHLADARGASTDNAQQWTSFIG